MTFDEYWKGCTDGLPTTQSTEKVRAVAKLAWNAAHENAARICEQTAAPWPRNDWVETGADGCDECAKAIRESSK